MDASTDKSGRRPRSETNRVGEFCRWCL